MFQWKLNWIAQASNNLVHFVSSHLFHEQCRICRQYVDLHSEATTLCSRCWSALAGQEIIRDFCSIGEGLQLEVVSATEYDEMTKMLIYRLKYDDDQLIAADLAKLMLPAFKELSESLKENNQTPVLVPIPLSFWKKMHRGFNQSEVIVEELKRMCEATIERKLLFRQKNTRAQHKLNKYERKQNLSGAFTCRKNDRYSPEQITVVLLDDIYTSGSTLCEAAQTLHSSGYMNVCAITVSRAVLEFALK